MKNIREVVGFTLPELLVRKPKPDHSRAQPKIAGARRAPT